MAGRRDTGFTVIELLLVVTIVGIIASVAVPSLIRARSAAAETSTIGSIRTIHAAQTTYATSCGGGYYAPTIASLGTPPKAGTAAYIGPEFKADTIDRQQYRIRFTAGTKGTKTPVTCNGVAAGQALSTFFVAANLLQTTTGMTNRYFGVNQTGVIYESTKTIAVFYAGAPPAPARTLR